MSLSAAFSSFSSAVSELDQALQSLQVSISLEVCRVAVETYIRPKWPVDTGRSKDAWGYRPTATGAQIICDIQYASYVFAKKDTERIPIYPGLVENAIANAIDEIGVAAVIQDITEAYIGQGRKTAHLTGASRKFLIHTPSNQAQAWRENCPQMIEVVDVFWNGKQRLMEIVPSDTVAGAMMGTGILYPRR